MNSDQFDEKKVETPSSQISMSDSQILAIQTINKTQVTGDFASYITLQRISQKMEENTRYSNTPQAQYIRHKYRKIGWLRKLVILLYVTITAFQRPVWCDHTYKEHCSLDQSNIEIHTFSKIFLPNTLYYTVEIAIIVFFILTKLLKLLSQNYDENKRQIYIALLITGIVILINDCIVLAFENDVRWNISTILKPVVLNTVLQYFRIINKGKEVFYLMIFSQLFFAGLGMALFSNFEQNPIFQQQTNQFYNFLDVIYTLFVLQTTVVSPDLYLPYYSQSGFAVIYFIIFQFVNTLLIVNMILALFYSSYKGEIQSQTHDLINRHHVNFEKYTSRYINKRSKSVIRQQTKDFDPDSAIELFLFQIMDSIIYEICMEVICFAIFCLIFLQQSTEIWLLNLVLNSIVLIEELIICYMIGLQQLDKKKSLLYYLIITIILVVMILVQLISPQHIIFVQIIKILMCQRLLRVNKLLLKSKQFTFIVVQFVQLLPYLIELFAMLLMLFMFYSALGQLVFGGVISKQTIGEINKSYQLDLNEDYYLFNFNDYVSGLVSCWFLLIVNNWNYAAQIFEIATDSKFAHLFFISFYITAVLLTLNVTLALLIDYLVSKWIQQKSPTQSLNEPFSQNQY